MSLPGERAGIEGHAGQGLRDAPGEVGDHDRVEAEVAGQGVGVAQRVLRKAADQRRLRPHRRGDLRRGRRRSGADGRSGRSAAGDVARAPPLFASAASTAFCSRKSAISWSMVGSSLDTVTGLEAVWGAGAAASRSRRGLLHPEAAIGGERVARQPPRDALPGFVERVPGGVEAVAVERRDDLVELVPGRRRAGARQQRRDGAAGRDPGDDRREDPPRPDLEQVARVGLQRLAGGVGEAHGRRDLLDPVGGVHRLVEREQPAAHGRVDRDLGRAVGELGRHLAERGGGRRHQRRVERVRDGEQLVRRRPGRSARRAPDRARSRHRRSRPRAVR